MKKVLKVRIEVEFCFWVLNSHHWARDAGYVIERAIKKMSAWGKVKRWSVSNITEVPGGTRGLSNT